ncbi:unnamed protein product [Choristocarpus tenellus]
MRPPKENLVIASPVRDKRTNQAMGGWTTSRHYTVPTTDIPMHSLSPLLPWFRSLLRRRLFPALVEQFGSGARAGGSAEGFAVHDAFVVRYEEGRQRHLPLHRDQSTHSFTIALNSVDKYEGGGTFFPCLGRSLRPKKGQVLFFDGGILHAGDPTCSGVRYIMACFVYTLNPDPALPGLHCRGGAENLLQGLYERATLEGRGGEEKGKHGLSAKTNVDEGERKGGVRGKGENCVRSTGDKRIFGTIEVKDGKQEHTEGRCKRPTIDFCADKGFHFGFTSE